MSLTNNDPYAILGIRRDASDDQVRRAYRRLAKRYHPDLHPDARTSEQMLLVNGAWETLSNAASRARYDAESAPPSSTSFEHWSAGARHTAPASPPPQTWSAAWASPSTARTYSGPVDADPRWLSVTGSVAVGLLLLAAVFFGILPAPLLGIVLLVVARSTFARSD